MDQTTNWVIEWMNNRINDDIGYRQLQPEMHSSACVQAIYMTRYWLLINDFILLPFQHSWCNVLT